MTDDDSAEPGHPNGGVGGYEPTFVDVDGTRTRYYDIGEGEPLVLVHGGNWSGLSNANTWAENFAGLSEQFRVIAFDRLGCGMTDNPEDEDAYVYRSELDHALAVLRELDIDHTHIAGSSRGGGLATRMAVEDPDRFDTLIILNSATLGPPSGDHAFRYDRLFERWCPVDDPTDPEYTRFRYTQYAHQTEHITDEFCRTNAWMRSRPKALETAEVMEAGGGQERWERTMRAHMDEAHQRIKDGVLTIPTLYVFGRNDLTVPMEMAVAMYDEIAQENSRVRMKVFNECGHLIYREYPEEFNQTVVDFVDYWH